MRLITALKAKYPNHGFEQDAVSGVISFTFEGVTCTDPFVSDCARFCATPMDSYDIEMSDAILIFDHNLPLEATYGNRPE